MKLILVSILSVLSLVGCAPGSSSDEVIEDSRAGERLNAPIDPNDGTIFHTWNMSMVATNSNPVSGYSVKIGKDNTIEIRKYYYQVTGTFSKIYVQRKVGTFVKSQNYVYVTYSHETCSKIYRETLNVALINDRLVINGSYRAQLVMENVDLNLDIFNANYVEDTGCNMVGY